MTHISIRRAGAADVPRIREIARAAYAPFVTLIGREPAPMIADFAALTQAAHIDVVDAPELAGYCVHYRSATTGAQRWHLENIAIDPAFQGAGLGRFLIGHVETTAKDAGASIVDLYTNAKMTANLMLYRHLGYVETERAFQDGFDRVFFEKYL